MKQHTPTPWNARPIYAKDGRFELRSERHQSVGYAPLAYVRGDKRETGGDGEANAQFIVRACNAHDQLVAALKAVVEFYSYAEFGPIAQAREALAAAGAA